MNFLDNIDYTIFVHIVINSLTMKKLRQDMSKVIISKRVLFVCEYNTVVGVMVRYVILLIDF